MKTFRLILTFYKSFAFSGLVITLACLGLLYGFGAKSISFFIVFFWFKVITLAATIYIVNTYQKNQFYYYKNLGVSKRLLWIPTILFDFTLFLSSLLTLALQLHDSLPSG